jgi:hypothetical protein
MIEVVEAPQYIHTVTRRARQLIEAVLPVVDQLADRMLKQDKQ